MPRFRLREQGVFLLFWSGVFAVGSIRSCVTGTYPGVLPLDKTEAESAVEVCPKNFGEDLACMAVEATANEVDITESGFDCVHRSTCENIQSMCEEIAMIIISRYLEFYGVKSCKIGCCYNDNCNAVAWDQWPQLTTAAPTTPMSLTTMSYTKRPSTAPTTTPTPVPTSTSKPPGLTCYVGKNVIVTPFPQNFRSGNFSASEVCPKMDGEELACVRVDAESQIYGSHFVGEGFECVTQKTCATFQAECSKLATFLIGGILEYVEGVRDCNIGCCYTNDCNKLPMDQWPKPTTASLTTTGIFTTTQATTTKPIPTRATTTTEYPTTARPTTTTQAVATTRITTTTESPTTARVTTTPRFLETTRATTTKASPTTARPTTTTKTLTTRRITTTTESPTTARVTTTPRFLETTRATTTTEPPTTARPTTTTKTLTTTRITTTTESPTTARVTTTPRFLETTRATTTKESPTTARPTTTTKTLTTTRITTTTESPTTARVTTTPGFLETTRESPTTARPTNTSKALTTINIKTTTESSTTTRPTTSTQALTTTRITTTTESPTTTKAATTVEPQTTARVTTTPGVPETTKAMTTTEAAMTTRAAITPEEPAMTAKKPLTTVKATPATPALSHAWMTSKVEKGTQTDIQAKNQTTIGTTTTPVDPTGNGATTSNQYPTTASAITSALTVATTIQAQTKPPIETRKVAITKMVLYGTQLETTTASFGAEFETNSDIHLESPTVNGIEDTTKVKPTIETTVNDDAITQTSAPTEAIPLTTTKSERGTENTATIYEKAVASALESSADNSTQLQTIKSMCSISVSKSNMTTQAQSERIKSICLFLYPNSAPYNASSQIESLDARPNNGGTTVMGDLEQFTTSGSSTADKQQRGSSSVNSTSTPSGSAERRHHGTAHVSPVSTASNQTKSTLVTALVSLHKQATQTGQNFHTPVKAKTVVAISGMLFFITLCVLFSMFCYA